ncbi:ABC transporter ATP-binding protein/permease VMR1 [Thalictrum thalictroides]|uniref:ABC transporter ATP-binding protein/permease VMR1 n=1 Tax=Thalictrum thalictroides TaxID=46969 RepID=A0A7J6V2P0_THATH|nr:ABC transporter ATP-binding protein/permease VMR1 [Thalictrum thalictroides]
MLEEILRRLNSALPLHWWLVVLIQGLTWLFVSLIVGLRGRQLSKGFLRLWSILTCLYAGILCVFSAMSFAAYKEASVKIVLDVLSLPGAVLLLLCVYKTYKSEETGEPGNGNGLYTPLNGEADGSSKVDSDGNVTLFAKAGLFSRMSFWWLNPLMKKGKEKTLEDEDIPRLREEDCAGSCYSSFLEQLDKQKRFRPSTPPSILWTLIVHQWKGILVSGIFALLKVLTLSCGPLLLNAFIEVAEGKEVFKYEGYVLALSLFVAKCLESISQRQWFFRSRIVGIQVRSLLSAAIYRKQMRLSNAAKLMHSSGEIMNYVTVDAYRIGEFPFWFHQTWTTSLQLCIALGILVHAVGLATIAALLVIILTVLCNTPLAKLQHKFQTKLMMAQDERLKATSEALVNMKVLKLYAWETHFKSIIEKLRKEEYKWLSAVQLRKAYNGFLFWSSPVLVSAATFGACYFLGVPLYASNVFTFVATLRLVQDPIRAIPDVIGVVIQAKVAWVRIIRFLEAPELQNETVRQKCDMKELKHAISIESADFSWEENPSKPTLRNINLEAKPGEKLAICGEVGSGKSTLLAAILGEVSIVKGMEYVMEALSAKTVLLVTHQVDFLPVFDSVLLISDAEILHAAPYHQLLATSQEFQVLVNAHKETAGSEMLANVVPPERAANPVREIKKTRDEKHLTTPTGDQLIKIEEKETGDSGLKPYVQYLCQNKGYLYFSIACLGHLTFMVGQILQNSWMAANVENTRVSEVQLIVVYLVIGITSTSVLLVRSLSIVALGMQSSKSLFSQLLNSLFRAPMSFYDSTPLGRILTRVASDLSIVDLDVPFSLLLSVGATLNTYSNLGVLAVVTWPVLFVSIPMVYLAILLQRYYFSSAKELMRINGTTKSMLANHLAESIAGAMTIRAFDKEDRFFAQNLDLIDTNASPFFHNFSANEWLIQRLEILSATVISSSALAMVLLPTGTFSSGFIGMAFSYGLSLNMSLVFSIQNQCTLANYIISVERLNQYMHIQSEAPVVIDENRPPPSWPNVGRVDIQDLKIRYRPNTPFVLRGISCTFEGGHKIGIVGRTGSGKTTLISALFRLVEPAGGKIVIDGLDISTIGLHDLRSRFGIIPQDPTLFNGTVRYNLDPLFQHNDQEIWEVLGKCQLQEAVRDKVKGLDAPVVEDGSNWSMGQRQLFCLGRALLRKSRILVLDEATASIDNATDTILQRTIRTEFADCTVITVAHRIPTVMDCTMVLGISDGKLVEYDEPMKLMNRQGSLFGQLVKEYWSHSEVN